MGPLTGVKVVELAGIGPGPFCAMLLADMGADVIRIDRMRKADLGIARDPKLDLLNRGRRSVAVDLKKPEGPALVLDLIAGADMLVEGFRPGVMERLGLGPDVCLARNGRLIYGRMTGWGQDGPLAQAAGHDINYIGLSGALYGIGRPGERPVPPLNLVGDFGGGALYLAFGLVCALLEARQSGKGQVVDAAMTEGSASLMTLFFGLTANGHWRESRGSNVIDGGAPYYDVYETADAQYVAVGAIEERFYRHLIDGLGLSEEHLPTRDDPANWPDLRRRFAEVFKTRDRDDWCDLFKDIDACVTPVISMAEMPTHPHHQARRTLTEASGVLQPAPAPRFSRTPGAIRRAPPAPGEEGEQAMRDWGIEAERIAGLRRTEVVSVL